MSHQSGPGPHDFGMLNQMNRCGWPMHPNHPQYNPHIWNILNNSDYQGMGAHSPVKRRPPFNYAEDINDYSSG